MLHSAIRLQTKAEDAADICIETLKGNLNHWLSKKNRVYINKLMGYHPKDRQVIFFQAIMDYLLFGVKPNLPTETLKVHFENVCKRIDEDAITLPLYQRNHLFCLNPRVQGFKVAWNGWSDMSFYPISLEN